MKPIKRKLSLHKLTIRVLDLPRVVGGAPRETEEGASCNTCTMTCPTPPVDTTFQSYEC